MGPLTKMVVTHLAAAMNTTTTTTTVATITNSTDPIITISCIADPLSLYFIIALFDLVAYLTLCWVAFFRYSRAFLFAANLALGLNLLLAVYVDPSFGISLGFVAVVALAGFLLFSFAGTVVLLVAGAFLVGLALFTLQSFMTSWVYHLTGATLTVLQVDVLFLVMCLVSLILVYFASSNHFLTDAVDSAIMSSLAVYAVKFLIFWSQQVWVAGGGGESSSSPEYTMTHQTEPDGQLLSNSGDLCCDDVHVMCPVWLSWADIIFILILFSLRLSFLTYMEMTRDRRRVRQSPPPPQIAPVKKPRLPAAAAATTAALTPEAAALLGSGAARAGRV